MIGFVHTGRKREPLSANPERKVDSVVEREPHYTPVIPEKERIYTRGGCWEDRCGGYTSCTVLLKPYFPKRSLSAAVWRGAARAHRLRNGILTSPDSFPLPSNTPSSLQREYRAGQRPVDEPFII